MECKMMSMKRLKKNNSKYRLQINKKRANKNKTLTSNLPR